MNDVKLIGRITSKPAMRTYGSESGDKAVANFSIAVPRRFKRDEADFFECVAFGHNATFIENYMDKGTKVAISGFLRQNVWVKEGQTRSKVIVNVTDIEFAGSNPNAGQPNKPQGDSDVTNIPDDVFKDLPFSNEIEIVPDDLPFTVN